MRHDFIHNVNGKHLTTITFIVVAASIPSLWCFRVQMGQSMTNGIFYYCCIPSFIFGILTWGYYHRQYIKEDNELIEEIGYFSFGKKYKIKISDIKKITYFHSVRRDVDNRIQYGQEQVSFCLYNGMEVRDFTLANRQLMSRKIKEINKEIIKEEIETS